MFWCTLICLLSGGGRRLGFEASLEELPHYLLSVPFPHTPVAVFSVPVHSLHESTGTETDDAGAQGTNAQGEQNQRDRWIGFQIPEVWVTDVTFNESMPRHEQAGSPAMYNTRRDPTGIQGRIGPGGGECYMVNIYQENQCCGIHHLSFWERNRAECQRSFDTRP